MEGEFEGTSELCHEQAHSISLYEVKAKELLKPLEKVFKSGKKAHQMVKTLEEMAENEIVLETLYSPQGALHLARGSYANFQSLPIIFPIFKHICIPPWLPWRFSQ